jgi:hypothetical protein
VYTVRSSAVTYTAGCYWTSIVTTLDAIGGSNGSASVAEQQL